MKKMLSLALGAALLAAAGTAYAATSDSNPAGTPSAPAVSAKPFANGMLKGAFTIHNEELQSLLGLDQAALAQELASGKSLAAIAEAKGVTKQQLVDLLVKLESGRLDQAVKDGKITQTYADQQKTALADKITAMVEKPGIAGKHMQGGNHGKGNMMKGRDKGMMEKHSGIGHQTFGDVADTLGMTEKEIKEQYRGGKSLSEIAESKGLSKDQLIDSLASKQKDRIKTFVDQKLQAPEASAPAAAN